jgi:glycosyltransferase involved in cell wall biosynthesis
MASLTQSPRVFNVLFDERVGGPQLRVLQIARRLKSFETIVIIPKGDPKYAALLKQSQIPYREIDLVRLRYSRNPLVHGKFLAKFWPNVAALRRLIREHQVKIVHTNGLRHLQAAIAARLEGVKLIWHLNDVVTPPLLRLTLLPFVRSWANHIAVAARAVERTCFADAVEQNGQPSVLYAPVDTGRFNPGVNGSPVRFEFGIGDCSPVVGMVANVCPGKGFEYLLEATTLIKRRYPTTKFLFVGGMLQNRRAYWDSLRRRIEELGLARDVILTGQRDDVPQIMRALTVFVQASESEACPMAVLEASASGLPVVATNVGGTPELVEDGTTGILIEPRNPAEIAKAVLRLLECPETAHQMGQAGTERMRRHFSLDACVEAHARMYGAVLNRAENAALTDRAREPVATENIEDVYSRN